MISCYTGTCGSGKTFHAVQKILEKLKKGGYAIGNIELNVADKYKSHYKYVDMYDITIGLLMDYAKEVSEKIGRRLKEDELLLVVDEAQLIFNCREWNQQGRKEWTKFFQLHRKLGYGIILVTQMSKMLDKQIYGVMEYEVIHRKASNFGIKGKLVSAIMLSPTLFVAVTLWSALREKISVEMIPYSKGVARAYDTTLIY